MSTYRDNGGMPASLNVKEKKKTFYTTKSDSWGISAAYVKKGNPITRINVSATRQMPKNWIFPYVATLHLFKY